MDLKLISTELTKVSNINIPSRFYNRMACGIKELDDLFGGGILPGSYLVNSVISSTILTLSPILSSFLYNAPPNPPYYTISTGLSMSGAVKSSVGTCKYSILSIHDFGKPYSVIVTMDFTPWFFNQLISSIVVGIPDPARL